MFLILLYLVFPVVDSTTTPPNVTIELNDQEVFVGEEAKLLWKLNPHFVSKIDVIKFGIVTRLGVYGERLEAIVVRLFPSGNMVWNKGTDQQRIVSFRDRTKVLENETAGFSISNVQLGDSSEFYCSVRFQGTRNTVTDYVFLRVVDVQILSTFSSHVVPSWKNNKVQLSCYVKVAPNTPLKFVWRNKGIGNAVSNYPQRDDGARSVLTIRTYDDADFGPYVCVAMTPNTNQTHEVLIKRLYKPSAPGNVTRQRLLKPQNNCSVQTTVSWMPPLYSGGTEVTHYVIEYKPLGEGWWGSESAEINSPYMVMCRPPRDRGGDGLEMRVKAGNVVGLGEPSEVFIVTFWGEPTPPRNLGYYLVRNNGFPFVRVTWDYPHDDGGVSVTGYKVEYKTSGAAWENAIKTVTSFKETKIEKRTTINKYLVRVTAYNGVGASYPSEVLTVAFAEKPSSPRNVGIAATAHNTDKGPHIHIRWERPLDDGGSPISLYLLEYKEELQANWTQGRYAEVDDNEFVLTGIDRNLKYDLRVSAKNTMGFGPPSKVVTVKYTEEVFSAHAKSRADAKAKELYWVVMIVLAMAGIVENQR